MDITDTLVAKSDQLNAADLPVPITAQIERVSRGSADQPVDVWLRGHPHPWRPCKGMRRILVAAWGPDASTYAGRWVRLYCDPTVEWGGMAVGGIRIEALSHMAGPMVRPLRERRNAVRQYRVEPLPVPTGRQSSPGADPLAAACEALSITIEALDAVTPEGRPLASTLQGERRQQAATWLRTDQGAERVKAARDWMAQEVAP